MEKPKLLVDAKMGGCAANPGAAVSVIIAQGGFWVTVCAVPMVTAL